MNSFVSFFYNLPADKQDILLAAVYLVFSAICMFLLVIISKRMRRGRLVKTPADILSVKEEFGLLANSPAAERVRMFKTEQDGFIVVDVGKSTSSRFYAFGGRAGKAFLVYELYLRDIYTPRGWVEANEWFRNCVERTEKDDLEEAISKELAGRLSLAK